MTREVTPAEEGRAVTEHVRGETVSMGDLKIQIRRIWMYSVNSSKDQQKGYNERLAAFCVFVLCRRGNLRVNAFWLPFL